MANQVLDIIKQRHHRGSKPGQRDDPYKVALCIEGGGLRGIVCGGGLAALKELNLKDTFDVVYGSSCGAYCGVFFLSGNPTTGARFFLDHSQIQFVSLKRFLRGGPLFDLDYVQHNMHTATPLNYHNVVHSKPPIHMVATDANHTRPITIKGYRNTAEVDRALHASATIPPRHRPKPLLFHKKKFLDGAFLDPFCLHSAVKEGCTHIMVLFSKQWQHRKELQIIDKNLVFPFVSRIDNHLAQLFLHHNEYSINGLSHIWNHYDGTHILTVSPDDKWKLPGQLTTKRKKLGQGFLAGAEAVLNTFAPDEHSKDLILASFRSELTI